MCSECDERWQWCMQGNARYAKQQRVHHCALPLRQVPAARRESLDARAHLAAGAWQREQRARQHQTPLTRQCTVHTLRDV